MSTEDSIEKHGEWSGIEEAFGGPTLRGGLAVVRGPRQRPSRNHLLFKKSLDSDGSQAEAVDIPPHLVTSVTVNGKSIIGAITRVTDREFPIKYDGAELDGPYDHWSGLEEDFGEPVVRRFGASKESPDKRERHFMRSIRAAEGPAVIPPTVTDRDPSQAGIEYGNNQVIEVTHELAILMQEAAEPELL